MMRPILNQGMDKNTLHPPPLHSSNYRDPSHTSTHHQTTYYANAGYAAYLNKTQSKEQESCHPATKDRSARPGRDGATCKHHPHIQQPPARCPTNQSSYQPTGRRRA